MQRLIEQPSGEGHVVQRANRLGRVHYHLSVYQHFSSNPDDAVPASLEVEGRISPLDQIDLPELHRRHVELTLELSDGRRLEFVFVNLSGGIRSTGLSLHEANVS